MPNLDHFTRRFISKDASYDASGPLVVVAFGDSITMGATTRGKFIPEEVYHRRVQRMLSEQFPGPASATLSWINAGIGGNTTTNGLARIERDVLRYDPDLVLVAFGTNDVCDTEVGAQKFERNLREIVRRIQAETQASVIMLTPPFQATCDVGFVGVGAEDQALLRELVHRQTDGYVAKFAEIVRRVAADNDLPVADVYVAWETRAAREGDMTKYLINGLNHPDASMHTIPAELIFKLLNDNLSKLQGT